MGIVALVGFDGAWNQLHEILFTNDLWLLDPRTDRLIQMFPETFWAEATFIVVGMALAEAGVLVGAAGGYLWFTRPPRAEREEAADDESEDEEAEVAESADEEEETAGGEAVEDEAEEEAGPESGEDGPEEESPTEEPTDETALEEVKESAGDEEGPGGQEEQPQPPPPQAQPPDAPNSGSI